MSTPTEKGSYLRQLAQANGKMLELNTALFKKLAELHEKYGILIDNSTHGELVIEFPKGTSREVIKTTMKELVDVRMG